jgi:hypothetical protein
MRKTTASLLSLAAAGALSVSSILSLQASPSTFRIDVSPMSVERKVFDPARPPSDMPALPPGEDAMCVYEFACTTEGRAEGRKSFFRRAKASILSLTVHSALKVTVWLPNTANSKLAAHEQGHVDVCEHYYSTAHAIAERLCREAVGEFSTKSPRTGVDAEIAFAKVQRNLVQKFIHETAHHCYFAQDHFDELTRHGLDPVVNGDAMIRAIAWEKSADDEAISKRSHAMITRRLASGV